MDFLLSRNVLWILVSVACISTVLTLYIYFAYFVPLEKKLKSGMSNYGIVDFELAFTSLRAEEILSAWNEEQRTEATRSLYVDFFFIISYVVALVSLGLLVSYNLHSSSQSVGFYLSLLPVVAGIFDVLENILLLRTLASPDDISDGVVFSAGLFALMKFILVGIAVFYIIITTIVLFSVQKFFAKG
jgi:hypothetical protein